MDEIGFSRHGAFTRADAIARFGRYRVRRAQESGEWHSPWSGVLVDAARAHEPLTLAAAAIALGGPDVLLASATAAHLHGCASAACLPIHIVTPYGHWLRSRPGLVVHNGPLPDADRATVLDMPVLGFERALTDLLCTWRRPAEALAVLDEALALIDPDRRERFRATIGRRLERRRDPRGTRRGAQLLGLATGLAESPAESRLLWRVIDSGFPPPTVNWSLAGPDGREVYRLDLAWPDLRIALEYNGHAVHADRTVEDEARADDLRRRGWIQLVVWAEDLRDPGRFERKLDQAFLRRGVDTSRRCGGTLRGRRHRETQDAYRRWA